MNRREFMRCAGMGVGAAFMAPDGLFAAEAGASRNPPNISPNILMIMTDQQTSTAMSCAGNSCLKTPAMDSIAEAGTRFDTAYVTQPLCTPFRSSLQTGRYPHEIGTVSNGLPITGEFPMLGALMGEAGYERGYIGKWHVGASFETAGYPEASEPKLDSEKTSQARAFLLREHDRPFFLTVSFKNPHDICQLARDQELPDGPIGDPPTQLDQLPPLPDNFDVPENEPTKIREVQKISPYHYPTRDWDELKWRQYLWGYYRLVEKVDAEIGGVLAALKESGHEENTVVLFTSDHGEGVAMHHWNQKQILYDQGTRVPMLFSWKGKTKGSVSSELVSTGLDIPATILDFAGAQKPPSMPGLSLKPVVMGAGGSLVRAYVVAETMFARGDKSFGLRGRMLRTRQYKYCVYDVGQNREQLFDMESDPGETRNLAVVDSYRDELNRHRELLGQWASQTDDAGFPFVAAE